MPKLTPASCKEYLLSLLREANSENDSGLGPACVAVVAICCVLHDGCLGVHAGMALRSRCRWAMWHGACKVQGASKGLGGGFMGLAKAVEALGLQSSRGFKGLATLGLPARE